MNNLQFQQIYCTWSSVIYCNVDSNLHLLSRGREHKPKQCNFLHKQKQADVEPNGRA